MKFNFIFLGQSVLKYETPIEIFNTINSIYEEKFNELQPANKQLIGKIKNEHTLFYDGENESKMKRHNMLPKNVLDWFTQMFHHYLEFNHIRNYQTYLDSIWVNEMKAHEYNPVHTHQGNLATGLSSVMILKLPNTFGTEYSLEENPTNGRLQILGTSNSQFAKVDYQPPMNLRDFYIFPYDMRHCVYPFNGTNETRRTLAANCDVLYNAMENRI